MSNYKGLFTFDTDGHKYVTVGAADGIITDIDCEPSELTEALIKDEKIRKAVRVWAEVNKTKYVWVTVTFDGISITQDERHPFPTGYKQSITFECEVEFKSGYYTIDELCGEEEE